MKKILLIEDDRVMRENTAEILELANFEVITAENGKYGVELARTASPDIILCDVMMPELDGHGVLYLLSKDPQTASIPFIFLTAKTERADIRHGMEMGADDYLTKPFEEQELLNAVNSRLRRKEALSLTHSNDLPGLNAFIDEARAIKELDNLSKDRKIRKFDKRDNIFFEGDEPQSLYFIASGKVKTFKMNDEGKEYTVGLHSAGEFLGYVPLLMNTGHDVSAAALEDTELCVIPREDFISLVHRNHDVSIKFIKMLSNNLADKERQLLELAYNSVRQRVAEALLHLSDKYRKDGEAQFSMSISRNDLASMVGTATESLIRTLSDLKDEGIVSMKGSLISIVDEKALKRVYLRAF
ncbi:MAG: response regulator [Flavobacteriales bacterium]|nr:response regulator [Flavobacteriales bacterium]